MRTFACALFAAVLPGVAFGQSTQPRPTFEIADVHASARSTNPRMTGGHLRAGRYELRRANMVELISTAYGVEGDNVVGGPSWLESDRFDVAAKAPPSTPPETVKLMLQSLLADRFKLVVHNDTRPMPSFVLSLGKGKPKLKEADGFGNTGCQFQPPNPAPGAAPMILLSCRNVTMDAFAQALRGFSGGYVTSPVVNSTDLKGSWNLDLQWTPRGFLGMAGSDGITVSDAIDRQLGLKLEFQQFPTRVIVVDSVNQKPTDNPPGVTKVLPPPPPTEFEVADIKPSLPDAQPGGGGFLPGGRIDFRAIPLRVLITIAWNIPPGDQIAGEPKWLDSARFDLIAKTATSIAGPANVPQIDVEDLSLMMRALLVDRFKMKTHYEDRPVTAYTLMAGKPKLTKADPSNRTGCKTGPAPAARSATSMSPPPRQAVCRNMTMAQFAEQLQTIAPMHIRYPVLDATGIDGSWDFTLTFSPVPPGQGRGGRAGPAIMTKGVGGRVGGDVGPPPDGSAPEASDPSGAISLFDAVSRQLGLKLEAQKRPMPVLVIDHIEQKPTEN